MTSVDLPQSVKVHEAYAKGNANGNRVTIELPHSVKLRAGYVKSNVKRKESGDFIAVREGPRRYAKTNAKSVGHIGERRSWRRRRRRKRRRKRRMSLKF